MSRNCPFLFTSGSTCDVSHLGSCGGFKAVCLALMLSPPGRSLPSGGSSPAHRSPRPPACPGLLYGLNPPALLASSVVLFLQTFLSPEHPELFRSLSHCGCYSFFFLHHLPVPQDLDKTSCPLSLPPSGRVAPLLLLVPGCVL